MSSNSLTTSLQACLLPACLPSPCLPAVCLPCRDPSKYASGSWNVKSKDMEFAIPVPSLHQTPL